MKVIERYRKVSLQLMEVVTKMTRVVVAEQALN